MAELAPCSMAFAELSPSIAFAIYYDLVYGGWVQLRNVRDLSVQKTDGFVKWEMSMIRDGGSYKVFPTMTLSGAIRQWRVSVMIA